ncbi:ADP-glyceromanno-heptose 6-epimerase [bacterium]|jgi:ADP-L-glycero-D-manno-heptose 6-epimerase|nr:ADP-glyceromanno-heptose 6-epimerase [bacterium]
MAPSQPQSSVLVTGAAGFIGSRIVESCNERGIPVISVDKLAFFGTRSEHQGVQFCQTVDFESLFPWLEAEKPHISSIVHMGACTDTFELNEAYLKKVNLDFSQQLWNYATEKQIPMVYASSAATYGEGELGYDDDEGLIPRLKPLNPYGESKRLFDLWVLEQEKKKLTPPNWAGFKFFNVYGFGERHKGRMASVVLHAFDQIRKDGKVKLFRSHNPKFEDGYQCRDFISVSDVVNVLEFAIERPIRRGIYNLGTGKARPFVDLVHAVFKTLGQESHIEYIDTPAALRERYQYFTEAKMDRLKQAGYSENFLSLEAGVEEYVRRLL